MSKNKNPKIACNFYLVDWVFRLICLFVGIVSDCFCFFFIVLNRLQFVPNHISLAFAFVIMGLFCLFEYLLGSLQYGFRYFISFINELLSPILMLVVQFSSSFFVPLALCVSVSLSLAHQIWESQLNSSKWQKNRFGVVAFRTPSNQAKKMVKTIVIHHFETANSFY